MVGIYFYNNKALKNRGNIRIIFWNNNNNNREKRTTVFFNNLFVN